MSTNQIPQEQTEVAATNGRLAAPETNGENNKINDKG